MSVPLLSSIVPRCVDRDLPLTRDQLEAVYRRALRRAGGDRRDVPRRVVLMEIVVILAGIGVILAGWELLYPWMGRWYHPLHVAVILAVLFALHRILLGRRFVLSARRLVREGGVEVCMGCGHWLRGLGDDVCRCPECGETREPMRE